MITTRRLPAFGLGLASAALAAALAIMPASVTMAQQQGEEFPAEFFYPQRGALKSLEGKPAPPLQIASWIGESVDLASLRGKVVVVDFWATWCGPCMKSLPHNVQLEAKYRNEGLVIVGVHTIQRGGWNRAPQVVQSNRITYPVGLDDRGKTEAAWRVGFWPTYGVVDRKGIVRALGLTPGGVEPVVKKLLAEPGESREKSDKEKQAKKPSPPPARWLEGTSSARQRLESVLEDETAPALEGSKWLNVPEADAPKGLKLEDFRGKVVLLDFCLPTRDTSTNQMVRNNQLYNKHREAGLVVIGVCRPDGADQIADVVSKLGIEYPVFVDDGKATANAYRADGAPDTYLIDRSGRLRVADCKETSVEDAIALLLKEEPPKAPTQARKGK